MEMKIMPKCLWERQNGKMLTEIAMDVRQSCSGAAEWYSELSEDIKILEEALTNWEPSIAQWTERVDNSVRNLIESVLLEIKRSSVWSL